MKRALILASVASMIDQFNLRNIAILQELGYEVHVAANFTEGNTCSKERIIELKKKLRQKKVSYFQIDFARNVMKLSSNIRAYCQVRRLCVRYHYDMLHCHSPIGGVVGRLIGHRFHIYTIYTAHGFHFYQGAPCLNWLLFYPIEKCLSYFTDVLLVINHEDYALAKKKFYMRKLYYIPGIGIEMPDCESADEIRKVKRKELGIAEQAFVIVSVAEFTTNKNQITVIKSMEKIKNPDIYFIMCGIGEKKAELENYVRKKQLEKNIKFAGFRKDVHEILRAGDCFVLSSVREGLSVALMEAMAEGLPVVCSRIRGNVDLVQDGAGGCLVSPIAVDEYRDAFMKLYVMKNKEPEKFMKMGQMNREKIKKFDSNTVDAIMRGIYRKTRSEI